MIEQDSIDPDTHLSDEDAHAIGGTVLPVEMDPRVSRAAEVAALIDPDNTLPDVELIPNPTKMQQTMGGTQVDMNYVISHRGVEIGTATLVTHRTAGECWFSGVNIEKELRGKGYGTAVYKAAIVDSLAKGFSFRTHDYSQTESSKNVWENLERRGAARAIRPFTSVGNNRYDGYYVVDAYKE